MLDVVAQIILGPGYAGTAAWQARWKEMPDETVRQTYTTLVSREDDVRARLGELDMPALVIHGAQDAAIPLDVAREMVEALPHAELVVIDGAGHAANLTHPEEVNPPLERFLGSL